jgi:hypothetical protein
MDMPNRLEQASRIEAVVEALRLWSLWRTVTPTSGNPSALFTSMAPHMGQAPTFPFVYVAENGAEVIRRCVQARVRHRLPSSEH